MTGGMIFDGAFNGGSVGQRDNGFAWHDSADLKRLSCLFDREAIRWDIIRGYLLGSVGAVGLFLYLVTSFDRPSAALVYLALGALPLLPFRCPKR